MQCMSPDPCILDPPPDSNRIVAEHLAVHIIPIDSAI